MSTAIKKRLLVLGGNGYVGQNICNAAVASGRYIVRSLNRSGEPPKLSAPEHLRAGLSQVEWISGDVFDKGARDAAMADVDVAVSSIGAFGSNEFMERICGDATIQAVESAAVAGVSRFGFVSSAQVGWEGSVGMKLPESAPMYGYYRGKHRAEQALMEAFPESYAIARPGFIYGRRHIGPLGVVPLQLIGEPVTFLGTKMGPISSLIQGIPFVGTEVSSMVHVESLARALSDNLSKEQKLGLIMDAEAIRKF